MALAVVIPLALYLLLALRPVQTKICRVAETELSRLLGARLTIGSIDFRPFNTLTVNDATLTLGSDTIATVSNLSAGFKLFHYLRTGDLVIDYALLDGFDARIWREHVGAPLNIDPIIAHLRSDKPKEPSKIDLRINTVVVRKGSASYHVLDREPADSATFDPSHISVRDIAVNATIPRIGKDSYQVVLTHLSLSERSGFTLSDLEATAVISPDSLKISDFRLRMPRSDISLADLTLPSPLSPGFAQTLNTELLNIRTTGTATLTPADLAAFYKPLSAATFPLHLYVDTRLNTSRLEVDSLNISSENPKDLDLHLKGHCIRSNDTICYELGSCDIAFDGNAVSEYLPNSTLRRLGRVSASITGRGTDNSGDALIHINAAGGRTDLHASYATHGKDMQLSGHLTVAELNVGTLTAVKALGAADAEAVFDITVAPTVSGTVDMTVSALEAKGYKYSGIALTASGSPRLAEATLSIDDPNARLSLYAFYSKEGQRHALASTFRADDVDLAALGIDPSHPGMKAGANAIVDISASGVDDISGFANLSRIHWADADNRGLHIDKVDIEAEPDGNEPHLSLRSDFLTASLTGQYNLTALAPQLKSIISSIFPNALDPADTHKAAMGLNDFTFSIDILPRAAELCTFFNLPIQIISDFRLQGALDGHDGRLQLDADCPALMQGNKMLENISLSAKADRNQADINAGLKMPTKKGPMTVATQLRGTYNRLATHVDWAIERTAPLNGSLDFSTTLYPRAKGALMPAIAIDINPGSINFGDNLWQIGSSHIELADRRVSVGDLCLSSGAQHIRINGTGSEAETDSITVDVRDLAIVPIFETLDIDKALINGRATGTFTGRALFSGIPQMHCPALHVDTIGYKYCTIGDADIAAFWNNDSRSVNLDADITGLEGKKSHIYGDIYTTDGGGLDLTFDVDSVPVGFLRPFLSNFASDISGRADGCVRLFGPFSEVDLEGAARAYNLQLDIIANGVRYTATDSIRMQPGLIELPNIAIHDAQGHTAILNGTVHHRYFKDASFRFDISNARNILCYDGSPSDDSNWSARLYGNGRASIVGRPGLIDISADMSTAPGTTFEFALSDRLDAQEYSFLTFRSMERRFPTAGPNIMERRIPTAGPNIMERRLPTAGQSQDSSPAPDTPTAYNMDFRLGINTDADMTLVMDRASGDRIRARGNGNIHMSYRSKDEDLNIWGNYRVAQGNYRFTLQDIIIKDFTLEEGSEVRFNGDPYAIRTDLKAYYTTNANLTDLDESFSQDKDLARTNVPVRAQMLITGDIRQPSIAFDLRFPTLTPDTYRKVRSIVSTEDMMNRQIIYLLALNRFYTPEYMSATTKGNELFSVASSTISGQLSNLLGKLSDNWTIAPNVRSDRGDFSDVEVDLALTSRLLNNRLIFNGNFGYRDKTLNSNQFVGDFDIEYLLNKRGTWRLKAYNRYNDRNFYVRSASTTQGVGIMLRRDFDSLGSFLRSKK